MIHFRHDHRVFQRRRWFVGRALRGAEASDIGWFKPDGQIMTEEDWGSGFARSLGVFLNGKVIPTPDAHGEPTLDDSFYILFNAHYEALAFKLPIGPWGDRWMKVIDTSKLLPELREQRQMRAGEEVQLEAYSMMVLRRVE